MNNSIVIDGIIFSLQRYGGISVYFLKLLETLRRHSVETSLILEEPLQQSVADETNILSIRREARLLERYRDCRLPENTSVYHSSYYRRPNRKNVPTVLTVYDFIYERFERGPRQWVHSAQKNAAIRGAQSIICISESTKDDLLHFIGETPGQSIQVIHCGVSDDFRSLNIETAPVPYVLFVGQRGGYKNFRLALEAMSFLPDIELHCVGGGGLRSDELARVPNSVARRVRHLGFVTDDELNVLYNQAVCLVYPSSYEGFGIPIIEAMRAGCPVVSTNCKAVLEVGGGALSVVYDDNPRAMSDAILNTLSSSRLGLIKRGLAVAKDYSWDKTHSQTLDVYRSLGANLPGSQPT